jgi:hypothetical protein
MTPEVAELLTSTVATWVGSRSDLRGLAVVGSWARGNARPDSDLDLLILATDLEGYRRDRAWLSDLGLEEAGYRLSSQRSVLYGVAMSWHLNLDPAAEIELTFAGLKWAATDPIDAGTRLVVADAFRVVLDKDGRLNPLAASARQLALGPAG